MRSLLRCSLLASLVLGSGKAQEFLPVGSIRPSANGVIVTWTNCPAFVVIETTVDPLLQNWTLASYHFNASGPWKVIEFECETCKGQFWRAKGN